jgi:hypothetical protein
MKTKVLIRVLLMCVCTCLGAESVLAAIWANQKAKQTGQSPRPQHREFLAAAPFNTKVERLPPNFKGDSMKRLYDTLEGIPEKTKMESTAAFYDRLEKAVDYNRYYTFVGSISPEYDADQQKLSFSIRNASAWDEARKVQGGSYRASNAYGATVTVSREHYEGFGIKNFSLPLKCKGKESWQCENEFKYELSAGPERARYLQKNLRTLYIGLLHFTDQSPSYTSLEVFGQRPTISSPYDDKTVYYLVNLWVGQVWLFDSATGEILEKHSEFPPRDDAHILPFAETQLRTNIVSTTTSGWMGLSELGTRHYHWLSDDDDKKPIQIEVVIGPNGKVESSGRLVSSRLTCWAEEVRQWEFRPFYHNGKLVRARGTLTFDPNETVRKSSVTNVNYALFDYSSPTKPSPDLRIVEADLTVDRDGAVVSVDNVNCDSRIQAEPGGLERVIAFLLKLRSRQVLEVCEKPVKFTVRGTFYFNSQYELK